jgi:glycerol-1-phosphate dehydrogenase [NAD(P)+]
MVAEGPHVVVFDSGASEEAAATDLKKQLESFGVESPFVLSSIHGHRVVAEIEPAAPVVTPVLGADQQWAADLGSRARRAGADSIIAAGGGRCIDVAKLAAVRAGVTVIAVPTQLSHDGICSPVAVVPDETGISNSLGAISPRAVFISIPTLAGAPPASVRAGLGDLMANPLALRDWALAAEHGLEEIDKAAWDLSTESFDRIEPHLGSDPGDLVQDPAFLRTLVDALVLSGMSMIAAGTSRPSSGGEHEISHAIDQLFGGKALHGAQVAFGCIFSMALYGEDVEAFKQRLARLGLPRHPGELGLSARNLVDMLIKAPETRPGRFTILEDADLDEAKSMELIQRIWPEG